MSTSLLLLALLCAAQPPAMAAAVRTSGWRTTRLVGAAAVAAVVTVVLTGLTHPVLSAVDVTAPTFRLAAAVVLGVWGARWLVLPAVPVPAGDDGRAADALAVALLLNPALVLVAMAGGSEHGVWRAGAWVTLVLAATAGLQLVAARCHPWALRAGSVTLGAVAIVIAISSGIDAARTV